MICEGLFVEPFPCKQFVPHQNHEEILNTILSMFLRGMNDTIMKNLSIQGNGSFSEIIKKVVIDKKMDRQFVKNHLKKVGIYTFLSNPIDIKCSQYFYVTSKTNEETDFAMGNSVYTTDTRLSSLGSSYNLCKFYKPGDVHSVSKYTYSELIEAGLPGKGKKYPYFTSLGILQMANFGDSHGVFCWLFDGALKKYFMQSYQNRSEANKIYNMNNMVNSLSGLCGATKIICMSEKITDTGNISDGRTYYTITEIPSIIVGVGYEGRKKLFGQIIQYIAGVQGIIGFSEKGELVSFGHHALRSSNIDFDIKDLQEDEISKLLELNVNMDCLIRLSQVQTILSSGFL